MTSRVSGRGRRKSVAGSSRDSENSKALPHRFNFMGELIGRHRPDDKNAATGQYERLKGVQSLYSRVSKVCTVDAINNKINSL